MKNILKTFIIVTEDTFKNKKKKNSGYEELEITQNWALHPKKINR